MVRILKITGLLLIAVFISSCGNANKNSDSSVETDNEISHENPENSITACPHASKIYWKASKPTGEHNGIIKLTKGDYIIENDELVGGEFIIDINSILVIDIENEEMNAKLVNHLKSNDFFNVDSFPEGKFVINSVVKIKEDTYNHQINGNLTLKNITKAISFKANVKISNGKVNATSEEFALDRTQWEINYKSKSIFDNLKDKFIDDEFKVKIDAYSM